MKNGHKYNLEYPKTVVLVRSGLFCNAFDDAALALVAITDYQVVNLKNGHVKCGFNLKTIEKVKYLLMQNHVSFIDLQTNTSNEQVEILDRYEDGSSSAFDTMRDKGREIVKARQQAGIRVSAIKNNVTLRETAISTDMSIADHKKTASIPSTEWLFINSLCQGKHPFTGEPIKKLDLNSPDIIRALFSLREKLK